MQLRTKIAAVLGAAGLGVGAFFVGTSSASIPDTTGEIHGCYDAKGNTRIIDSASESCLTGETGVNWPSQVNLDTYMVTNSTNTSGSNISSDCTSGDLLLAAWGSKSGSPNQEAHPKSFQTNGSGQPTGVTWDTGWVDGSHTFVLCLNQ